MNFWNNKKVLITGHTGFKGGWLTLWLKILGAKVCGYSINPITKPSFFKAVKLNKIIDEDHRKNIENFKDLKKIITKFKPEIIFHLAAQPQVLESYDNPISTINTNFNGTVNLLEILRTNKNVKSTVIITTDKVYNNDEKKQKFKEVDSLGGEDIYSSSKACADIITNAYMKSFFLEKTCNVSTARAGNCIGGGDWTKYRILTDAVNAFSKNGTLNLRNPNFRRPWQHLLEPLMGYILIAKKMYKNRGDKFCGAWNFGPDEKKHSTVFQLSKKLKKNMYSNSKIAILNSKKKLEKKYLSLDSSKAKKLIGWRPVLNENLAIKMTADWYLAFYNKENMLEFSKKQILSFEKILKKNNYDL